MSEDTEIVMGDDGVLVARAMWGRHLLEEPLPRGFESWEEPEQRAHLRRFVAPKLKAMMIKARKGHLPIGVAGYTRLTDEDNNRKLAAAEAKRERKRLKVAE